MKKLIVVLAIALALSLAAIAYLWPSPVPGQVCLVTGDVEQNIYLGDMPKEAFAKIPGGGRGLLLSALVAESKPLSSEFSVLLVGAEGLFAQLKGDELDGCYIVKDGEEWNTVVTQHPVNAEIKNLSRIVIADETDSLATGINIISQTANLLHLTPGNMFRRQLTCYSYLIGDTMPKDGYAISLFRQKQVLPVAMTTEEQVESVLVMGKGGEYVHHLGAGFLELRGNEIHYLQEDGKAALGDIAGVIINPPAFSVLDCYSESLFYLERNQRVLLVCIDGLGYYQYEQANANNRVPNLAALGDAHRANTVYKPVTNVGLAAIVSGQPPAATGVTELGQRQLRVRTIFDELEAAGRVHALIEGDQDTIDLNTEVIYSPDLYADGSNDDDVFGNAQAQVATDPHFLLVHFSGVWEAAQQHGPLAEKTFEALAKVDAYIGLLLKEWTGRVIVVASHGGHKADGNSGFGNFRFEDMFVPYFVD